MKRTSYFSVGAFILGSIFSLAVQAEFKGEGEAGLMVVRGNTESDSYSLKTKDTYIQDLNSYTFSGRYLQTKSNKIESAKNWEAGLRYERGLLDNFSLFVGHKIESDFYAGFAQRNSTDLGAKYIFVKENGLQWFGEAGYRYTTTNPTLGTSESNHFGRFYTEVSKNISQEIMLKYWLEYLPNFSDSSAYLLNTEASMNVMLSQTFSLKLSYLAKYQNAVPAGAEKTDSTYTTSLVANF